MYYIQESKSWMQAPLQPERRYSNFFLCQVAFNVISVTLICTLLFAAHRAKIFDSENVYNTPMSHKMEDCKHRHHCGEFGEMVCGSDGLVYESECELEVTSCQFPEMNLMVADENTCQVNSVTLVGGKSPNEGNVYARNPTTGIFGPVCDDAWDIKGAFVVCQQLNYPGVLKYSIESYFGPVTPMFSYDDLKCDGFEDNLDNCLHIEFSDCSPYEGAGVVCDDGSGNRSAWGLTLPKSSANAMTTPLPTTSWVSAVAVA